MSINVKKSIIGSGGIYILNLLSLNASLLGNLVSSILKLFAISLNFISTMVKPTSNMLDYWRKGGIYELGSRAIFRTLQLIFAFAVAGIYGVDLAHSTKTHDHAHAEWIYAEFLATLSVLTSIAYLLPVITHAAWIAWDGILCILWVAQVGVFGTIYSSIVSSDYQHATSSISRMRAAVWIDLVNMILWLSTMVLSIVWCVRARNVARKMKQSDAGKQGLIAGEGEKGDCEENGRWSGEKEVKCFTDIEKGTQESTTPPLNKTTTKDKGDL